MVIPIVLSWRDRAFALWIVGLLLGGCGGKQPRVAQRPAPLEPTAPTANAAPRPETVAADSPRATGAGTTFTLPARWTLHSDGTRRRLEGPEKDVMLAIVDVDVGVDAPASNAAEAVRRAWLALYPDFARPVRVELERPARNGWQAVRFFIYETSPNEQRALFATARRHGAAWCVLLLDGTPAGQDRRGAQINLVGDSLRPAGYVRESFAGKTAHTLDPARVRLVTDFVDKARVAAGVPGVGIGLVQGGKVVFAGGLGVRELGKPAPVDADTLFIIASNTKALTTLLLAKEVDLGKFTWDTPVTDVYPPFRLGDPDTTRRVLMKHLVCACTGMPRQDLQLAFEFASGTAASTLAYLATLKPTSAFGEVFQYSNVMAAAAGFVGGYAFDGKRELGAAYDEAMRREIFAPLGMRSTTFDFERALKGNHASPHGEDVDGRVAVMNVGTHRMVIPARPAGGAWSTVNDLSRYVLTELAKGMMPDGRRLMSEQALLARRVPQASIGEDRTYGMGLMVNKQYGVTVVNHGGDFYGYHSDMFWIPEAGAGGVILTNGDLGWRLRAPLVRRVLEVVYDGAPEAEEDVLSSIRRHRTLVASERKKLSAPADAAAAGKLASHYDNATLGSIAVTTQAKDTVFDFGEWRSRMASRKNDDGTISFVTIEPGIGRFEFVAGERDGKPTLTTRETQHDYVFLAK